MADIGNELSERPKPNPARRETHYFQRVEGVKHLPQPDNPFFQNLNTYTGEESDDGEIEAEGHGKAAGKQPMASQYSAIGHDNAQTGN